MEKEQLTRWAAVSRGPDLSRIPKAPEQRTKSRSIGSIVSCELESITSTDMLQEELIFVESGLGNMGKRGVWEPDWREGAYSTRIRGIISMENTLVDVIGHNSMGIRRNSMDSVTEYSARDCTRCSHTVIPVRLLSETFPDTMNWEWRCATTLFWRPFKPPNTTTQPRNGFFLFFNQGIIKLWETIASLL